jgi:hypothetical protein
MNRAERVIGLHAVQAERARRVAGLAPGEEVDRHDVGIGDIGRIVSAVMLVLTGFV